jgi:hypothetical protein
MIINQRNLTAGADLPLDAGGPAFLDLFNLPKPRSCRMPIRRTPSAS